MSINKVQESRRCIPISAKYDVAIIGGGIAGVSAAIAAARCGGKTVLIEKLFALGGLATLGNVTIFLPLCDGMGKKVSAGLAEELLKLSVCDGFEEIPQCWKHRSKIADRRKHRYLVNFNPATYVLELERLLIREGVEIMYDTRLCGAICKNGRVGHIVVENKAGRSTIKAKSFVDASGDADLCHYAGEKTASLATNVCCGWYYYVSKKDGLKRVEFTKPYDSHGKEIASSGAFSGINPADITSQIIQSRREIYNQMKKIRKKDSSATLINLPTFPTFRMTRRLIGSVELQESDDHKLYNDCVGIVSDWRKRGPIFQIPLRALKGVKNSNLFAAGRNISSDSLWDVTRSIPACAVTGQAAGIAAAMPNASYDKIAENLRLQKVIL